MSRTKLRTALSLTTCLATGALAFAWTGSANATPLTLSLTATDLTTSTVYTATFTDVAQGTPNTITVASGTQGSINFTGELSQATIGTGFNTLQTSATNVKNLSSTDTYKLTASLSGLNFPGPSNEVFVSGSGTWQSLNGQSLLFPGATYSWYDDPSNVGAVNPSTLVGTQTFASFTGITSSFNFSPPGVALAVPDGSIYSMIETWTYTLAPEEELVTRGLTETKVYTPEPASLALLGAGSLGLGVMRRRRRS